MWVLEELGSCWQAGRQLALATEAWAADRDREDSSLAQSWRGFQRGSDKTGLPPPTPLGPSGGHGERVSLMLLF